MTESTSLLQKGEEITLEISHEKLLSKLTSLLL